MTSQLFTLSFSPSLKTPINSNFSGDCLRCFSVSFSKKFPCSSFGFCLKRKTLGFDEKINGFGGNFGIFSAWREEGQLEELDDAPLAVELQQICSESQFDRVIAEAQQLEESLIILWMARWCRKCIYLKPKLEKLATDYYPRLRFYCVDVNTVPHNLVARAGVTKMPTIQVGGYDLTKALQIHKKLETKIEHPHLRYIRVSDIAPEFSYGEIARNRLR